MDRTDTARLEKLQLLADTILDKLKRKVEAEDPEQMNPQSLKHITGVMKDLRDIQLSRTDTDRDGLKIAVLWEGELERYSE